jgi:uncharacterized protein with PIN domain
MAIALGEPMAGPRSKAISEADRFLMSAVTKIELMIVAGRRNRLEDVEIALQTIDLEIVPVTEATIDQVTAAYD